MTKTACINSLRTSLTNTSRWRLNNAEKHPTDKRYERAARRLNKLASETQSLSIEQWAALEPYFQTTQWPDALRQTARKVGFAIKKMSVGFYVRSLIRLLDEPAAVA